MQILIISAFVAVTLMAISMDIDAIKSVTYSNVKTEEKVWAIFQLLLKPVTAIFMAITALFVISTNRPLGVFVAIYTIILWTITGTTAALAVILRLSKGIKAFLSHYEIEKAKYEADMSKLSIQAEEKAEAKKKAKEEAKAKAKAKATE